MSNQSRIVFLPKTINVPAGENALSYKPTPAEAEELGLYLREIFRLNGTNRFFVFHQVGAEKRVDPIGMGSLGDIIDLINRDATKWGNIIEYENVLSASDGVDGNHSSLRFLMMDKGQAYTITLGKLLELAPHKTRASDYATKSNNGFVRFATEAELTSVPPNDNTAVTPSGVRFMLADIGNVFNYCGRKATFAEVQAVQNPKIGDVWEVDDGTEYAYTSSGTWEARGFTTNFLDKRYERLATIGTCSEAATTVDKTVEIAELSNIAVGQIVRVKFTNGHTASSLRLKVNDDNFLPALYQEKDIGPNLIDVNVLYTFIKCSDDKWRVIGRLISESAESNKVVEVSASNRTISINRSTAKLFRASSLAGGSSAQSSITYTINATMTTNGEMKLVIVKGTKFFNVVYKGVTVIDSLEDTGTFLLEFNRFGGNTVDLNFVKKIIE